MWAELPSLRQTLGGATHRRSEVKFADTRTAQVKKIKMSDVTASPWRNPPASPQRFVSRGLTGRSGACLLLAIRLHAFNAIFTHFGKKVEPISQVTARH